MPLYEYRCPVGHKFERFYRMAEDSTHALCSCGELASKQLSAPVVRGDYAGYQCPISGKWIEGRRAHEENLARHGCRVLEAGEAQQAERVRIATEQQFEAALDATVERELTLMGSEKVARLCNEVADGTTAVITREAV